MLAEWETVTGTVIVVELTTTGVPRVTLALAVVSATVAPVKKPVPVMVMVCDEVPADGIPRPALGATAVMVVPTTEKVVAATPPVAASFTVAV
jgi:hypothetical protein